jgi:O-antigen ligase
MTATSSSAASSAAPAVLRPPVRLWQVAVAAAALPLGVAAAFHPALAVAAVLALVLLPVVLTRPIVGLSMVLLLSFLERYSALTGLFSVTKIVGALLVLSWLAFIATTPQGERVRTGLVARHPVLAAALVLFAAWASISLVWAEQPAAAQNSVLRFVLNFVLFPIALVAITRKRDVAWLFGVFIAGALVTVVFGFLEGSTGNPADADRLEGAGINPNQLGTYLVVAMVFAATFFTTQRWPPIARAAALAAGCLAAVGLFMTLSRGALVGLAAALLVAPFAVGRGRRAAALVLVVLTVAGTATWYAAIAPADAVDRITHPERGGGSGREDLWRVGWRMVDDRPVLGVGAGNFGVSSVHYLLRPGSTQRDKYIVVRQTVAHNIYLTVLAELGIVGLTLFVFILSICLRCVLLAAREFAARGDPALELLARALFIALVGLLVADFFSSALYSKQLWFLLAAAPALLALAQRSAARERRGTRFEWVRRAQAPAWTRD